MEKVILIEHKEKYDDLIENVGIALNKEVAEKYVEELKNKYPYVYNGRFYFSEFDLISE